MNAQCKAKLMTICFAGTLAIFCTLASADSLQLRNGRHLQGKFVGGSTTTIGFMTTHSIEYFQTTDVLSLTFDSNTRDDNSEPSTNGLQPNHMDGGSSSVQSPIDNELCRSRKSASGTQVNAVKVVLR